MQSTEGTPLLKELAVWVSMALDTVAEDDEEFDIRINYQYTLGKDDRLYSLNFY
jgi:hypothetical protein